jgi:hypothetical protein
VRGVVAGVIIASASQQERRAGKHHSDTHHHDPSSACVSTFPRLDLANTGLVRWASTGARWGSAGWAALGTSKTRHEEGSAHHCLWLSGLCATNEVDDEHDDEDYEDSAQTDVHRDPLLPGTRLAHRTWPPSCQRGLILWWRVSGSHSQATTRFECSPPTEVRSGFSWSTSARARVRALPRVHPPPIAIIDKVLRLAAQRTNECVRCCSTTQRAWGTSSEHPHPNRRSERALSRPGRRRLTDQATAPGDESGA